MDLDNRLILIVSLNGLAFVLFAWDKFKARIRKRRVSEAALLLVSVLGGGVGAAFAMLLFRHKTSKRSFKWKFYLCFALGIAANVFVMRS